ncbi:MAG: hypothetical protein Q8O98_01315, partial [bacterium]|nr:hypothetical protein [bacterium]
MASNFRKKFWKKSVALFFILSIIFPVAYAPLFAPRAEAVLGVLDINLESVPEIIVKVLESIGMTLAQRMVDDMVKETIKWANTGFEGGPSYVTDTEKYFTNIADGVAGKFIGGSDLNFLCSPFQAQIRLSLQRQYVQDRTYQCTLSGIYQNAENFGDAVNKGGWDTWFDVTQNDANNPYGAYFQAKLALDQRITSKVGVEKDDLETNLGFRSTRDCKSRNPSLAAIEAAEDGLYEGLTRDDANEFGNIVLDIYEGKIKYDKTKLEGECLEFSEVITPGSIVKEQLDKSLGSGMSRLINAQHIDQLVSAFANGLLQRYVFGPKGLFGSGTEDTLATSRELFDADKDGTPDGYDYDGDKNLDICNLGVIDPKKRPGVDPETGIQNCRLSEKRFDSPYFSPICERLDSTTATLKAFNRFISENDFNKDQSDTWFSRITIASGAVDDFINNLGRFEAKAWDNTLFSLGYYSRHLNNRITELAKKDRLGPMGDKGELNRMRINTDEMLTYLTKFKTTIG